MVRRRIPPNPKHMRRPAPLPSAEQAVSQSISNSQSSQLTQSQSSQLTESQSSQLTQSQSSQLTQSQSSQLTQSESSFLPLKISTLRTLNKMPPFITAYGPKTKVTLDCPELPFGRTKQSFKDETDINNIVSRFLKTGVLEFARKHEPRYGDVIGADFQTAMNTVATAKSMFADLPAKLRARFENDPGAFLDFVNDDNNREEAVELGLVKPAAAEATPLAPQGAQAAEQPQNRTQDGRLTFDKARSGPKGDAKTISDT